jgi:hypothetical protein
MQGGEEEGADSKERGDRRRTNGAGVGRSRTGTGGGAGRPRTGTGGGPAGGAGGRR